MITLRHAAPILSLALVAGACGAWRRSHSATPTIEALRPDSVFVAAGRRDRRKDTASCPGAPGRNTVRFGTVRSPSFRRATTAA